MKNYAIITLGDNMNNKGFTLIELLAIVTVLVTILVVSFPTLINMTRRDKEKQYNDMVNTICKAGETYIYENQELFPELGTPGNSLYVELDNLKNDELIRKDEINPKTKTNLFGRLEYTIESDKSLKCNFNPSLCTLIRDANEDGKVSIGDKYSCRVAQGTIYDFYVLSKEGNKVNLIMDRNICNDGTTNYAETNKYCRYKWHESNDNNYGPDTIMKQLYEGTKNWTNVPDMIMNYRDENNSDSDEYGYTGITTSNGVTTITGKQSKISPDQTFGNATQPLKARLPMDGEVRQAKCSGNEGSCPVWLMENITYYNVADDKYSMNNNNETYQNKIKGYWLLSSHSNYSNCARFIYYNGYVGHNLTTSDFGARPVITVLISDLSN